MSKTKPTTSPLQSTETELPEESAFATMGDVTEYTIPLPPLEEQREMVRRVEAVMPEGPRGPTGRSMVAQAKWAEDPRRPG